jgi:hypothetical protein
MEASHSLLLLSCPQYRTNPNLHTRTREQQKAMTRLHTIQPLREVGFLTGVKGIPRRGTLPVCPTQGPMKKPVPVVRLTFSASVILSNPSGRLGS